MPRVRRSATLVQQQAEQSPGQSSGRALWSLRGPRLASRRGVRLRRAERRAAARAYATPAAPSGLAGREGRGRAVSPACARRASWTRRRCAARSTRPPLRPHPRTRRCRRPCARRARRRTGGDGPSRAGEASSITCESKPHEAGIRPDLVLTPLRSLRSECLEAVGYGGIIASSGRPPAKS
jgi:hypothetical protein